MTGDDGIRFIVNGNVVSDDLAQAFLDRARRKSTLRWERALAEVRVERIRVAS